VLFPVAIDSRGCQQRVVQLLTSSGTAIVYCNTLVALTNQMLCSKSAKSESYDSANTLNVVPSI